MLQGFFFPSMSFFLGLGALLVLWLGSREVIRGRITLGEFVAFNAYLTMLSWPMIAFGWVTNMLQRGMASWKRMLEVLDTEPAIDPAKADLAASARKAAEETVRLRPAHHGRMTRRRVPRRDRIPRPGVQLRRHARAEPRLGAIEAGQTVALVGVTGSGKSTLINLLLARLHDPPPGTVFIDGVDVRDMPLAVLRAAPSASCRRSRSCSPTRWPTTSRSGWTPARAPAAGAPRRRTRRLRRIVRDEPPQWRAALDKDVADFPKGYDTMVGERGITLSGGQKQRTAIARAVVIDPRILILDDALSAVDTYTEEEILSRLRGVMRQRTSIIVSHRISTVRDADRILVLDEGGSSSAERTTSSSRRQRRVHKKQLLEEELAASYAREAQKAAPSASQRRVWQPGVR